MFPNESTTDTLTVASHVVLFVVVRTDHPELAMAPTTSDPAGVANRRVSLGSPGALHAGLGRAVVVDISSVWSTSVNPNDTSSSCTRRLKRPSGVVTVSPLSKNSLTMNVSLVSGIT